MSCSLPLLILLWSNHQEPPDMRPCFLGELSSEPQLRRFNQRRPMREDLATVALSDWWRGTGVPDGWDNSATAADNTTMLTEDRRICKESKRHSVILKDALKVTNLDIHNNQQYCVKHFRRNGIEGRADVFPTVRHHPCCLPRHLPRSLLQLRRCPAR